MRIDRRFDFAHKVWIKSERANPAGSIKGRIALAMIAAVDGFNDDTGEHDLSIGGFLPSPEQGVAPLVKLGKASQPAGFTPTCFRHRSPCLSTDIETLRRILAPGRTIAIVGLSADWWRPSYFAAKYLKEHGYRIVPVNPKYPAILGETAYPSLCDIPFPVEVVDVFRKPDDVPPIAREAIAIGAKVLWQQLGVINLEADATARAAGLDSVTDRCMKIEHARLFGGLGWVGVNTRVISAKRPRSLPY